MHFIQSAAKPGTANSFAAIRIVIYTIYSYPFINEYTYERWVDTIQQKFTGEQTVELHPH